MYYGQLNYILQIRHWKIVVRVSLGVSQLLRIQDKCLVIGIHLVRV